MSLSLGAFTREITVAGFVSDADPNVTPPAAALVWKLRKSAPNDSLTSGHLLAAVFNAEEAAANVAFKAWVKDASVGDWLYLSPNVLTHRLLSHTALVQDVDMFIQVTAINAPGAATKVTLRASEV